MGNISPRTVWGKVVLYLKERRLIALHVACGDITDVAISGNDFIINIDDGMMLNLMREGRREIESALRWQGFELNVVINTKNIIKSPCEQDVEKLQKIFGEVLTIKGGKFNGIQ